MHQAADQRNHPAFADRKNNAEQTAEQNRRNRPPRNPPRDPLVRHEYSQQRGEQRPQQHKRQSFQQNADKGCFEGVDIRIVQQLRVIRQPDHAEDDQEDSGNKQRQYFERQKGCQGLIGSFPVIALGEQRVPALGQSFLIQIKANEYDIGQAGIPGGFPGYAVSGKLD
ncbi:hypothetical protein D3C81_1431840 [compost metagenome]